MTFDVQLIMYAWNDDGNATTWKNTCAKVYNLRDSVQSSKKFHEGFEIFGLRKDKCAFIKYMKFVCIWFAGIHPFSQPFIYLPPTTFSQHPIYSAFIFTFSLLLTESLNLVIKLERIFRLIEDLKDLISMSDFDERGRRTLKKLSRWVFRIYSKFIQWFRSNRDLFAEISEKDFFQITFYHFKNSFFSIKIFIRSFTSN